MRTFLAADIESKVNDKIKDFIGRFRQMDRSVKWGKAETNHITIYFFGEVEENNLRVLGEIVSHALERITPFEASAAGISAFPSMKGPRIFWIGIENRTHELENIFKSIKADLPGKKIKVNIESKDFTPHLTVGRVKGRCDPETIRRVSAVSEKEFGSFVIDKIILYQSILRKEGPIYSPLKVFQL
jgi:2'-5' RNA ligase